MHRIPMGARASGACILTLLLAVLTWCSSPSADGATVRRFATRYAAESLALGTDGSTWFTEPGGLNPPHFQERAVEGVLDGLRTRPALAQGDRAGARRQPVVHLVQIRRRR